MAASTAFIRHTRPPGTSGSGVQLAPASVVRNAVFDPLRNTMPASGVVKSASAGVALPPAALPGVPGMAVTRLKLSPASVVRSTLPLRSSR